MTAVVLGMLAGCASPPERHYPVFPAGDPSTVEVSTIYARPAEGISLGKIEGVSCAKGMLGESPSREEAIKRMVSEAARRGATHVMHLRVNTGAVTPGCWSSIVARGTAYRDEEAAPE